MFLRPISLRPILPGLCLAAICIACAGSGLAWLADRPLPRSGAGMEDSHLELRTRLVWRPDLPEFGGISGLVMAGGGSGLSVLSDRARLFHGRVRRDGANRMTGIADLRAEALLNPGGAPLTPFNSDAEDMAPASQSVPAPVPEDNPAPVPGDDPETGAAAGDPDPARAPLAIAFEGLARVVLYPVGVDPAGRRAVRLHAWDRFADRFANRGFEALAALPRGQYLVIGESPLPGVDPGPGAPAFLYDGTHWHRAFDIPDPGGFTVSGADLGPDGRLWLLERRLGWAGFVTRIRRFDLAGQDDTAAFPDRRDPVLLGAGQTLLSARLGARDNYEALDVWRDADGATVATLISDDGFSRWQRTVVAEFVLVDAVQ